MRLQRWLRRDLQLRLMGLCLMGLCLMGLWLMGLWLMGLCLMGVCVMGRVRLEGRDGWLRRDGRVAVPDLVGGGCRVRAGGRVGTGGQLTLLPAEVAWVDRAVQRLLSRHRSGLEARGVQVRPPAACSIAVDGLAIRGGTDRSPNDGAGIHLAAILGTSLLVAAE